MEREWVLVSASQMKNSVSLLANLLVGSRVERWETLLVYPLMVWLLGRSMGMQMGFELEGEWETPSVQWVGSVMVRLSARQTECAWELTLALPTAVLLGYELESWSAILMGLVLAHLLARWLGQVLETSMAQQWGYAWANLLDVSMASSTVSRSAIGLGVLTESTLARRKVTRMGPTSVQR
jgi:hypothetical protein